MRNRVDFEFTKNWGSIKKGTKKQFRLQHARALQDVEKVGKICKPEEDKAEPKAKSRSTK